MQVALAIFNAGIARNGDIIAMYVQISLYLRKTFRGGNRAKLMVVVVDDLTRTIEILVDLVGVLEVVDVIVVIGHIHSEQMIRM